MDVVVSDRRRRELYIGTFPSSSWSAENLRAYFRQLLGRDAIVDCRFHPCGSERKQDHLFAILTFETLDDVNQCMEKSEDIRLEHHLILKRNLQDRPKTQRSLTNLVYISLKEFDPVFTSQNVSAYFGRYGKLSRIDSFNNRKTFLLTFDHYDAVDQILLDQPHRLHDHPLIVEKCYQPPRVASAPPPPKITKTLTNSDETLRLRAELESLTKSAENDFDRLKDEFNAKIAAKRKEQVDMMEASIRLRCDERELREKIARSRRTRDELKEKIRLINEKNAKLRRAQR